MDNETTKILNPQQNSETKSEQNVAQKEENNQAGFGSRTAATATGAALGTGAAFAAEHIYNAAVEDDAQEEVSSTEDGAENNAEETAAAEEVQATAAEPQHTVVEHVVTVKVEQPTTTDANTVPHDGTYIDPATPEPTPASTTTSDDNEVHVVGVAVQDNGQGGVSTLAGIQSGDDSVIVVDVESDGRLDYAIHDDNGNGEIDEGEMHDISGQNMSTAQVVGAYVEEAHAQGSEAVVTDLDSGNHYQITETENGYGLASMEGAGQDDNLYTASNDDMPDYMNDADAGIMDT